jgi:hypothetical protein
MGVGFGQFDWFNDGPAGHSVSLESRNNILIFVECGHPVFNDFG